MSFLINTFVNKFDAKVKQKRIALLFSCLKCNELMFPFGPTKNKV